MGIRVWGIRVWGFWDAGLSVCAMTTFKGFEPVFGAAQGQLEPPAIHDLLPFLFYLRATDSDHLLLQITDFHANTWYADMSIEYMEEQREDVGVGGPWHVFLGYVRDVFASENVKIILRGSSSAGATSASVGGQKKRESPKVRFDLTKLEGTAASDAMGTISVEIFKVCRSQAASLSSESARALQMSTAYAQEKARADILQDRLDALNFNKKKKRLCPTLSIDDPSLTQPQPTQSIVASQFATASVFEDFGNTQGAKAAAASSSGKMEPPKAKPAAKTGLSGPRLRAAPIGRKPKRRITVDSD